MKPWVLTIILASLIPLSTQAVDSPYTVDFFNNIPHANISISEDGKRLITAKSNVRACAKDRYAVFGLDDKKTTFRKIRKESSLPYFRANSPMQQSATIGFNHCSSSDVFIANIWGTREENNFFPLSEFSGMFSNHFDDAVMASDYSFILKDRSVINNYVLGPIVSRYIDNLGTSTTVRNFEEIFLSPDNSTAIYDIIAMSSPRFFSVVTNLPDSPVTNPEKFGKNLTTHQEDSLIDPIQWAATSHHAYITVPGKLQKIENLSGDITVTDISEELPDQINESFQTVISPNKKNAYFLTSDAIYYIPNFTEGGRIIENTIPLQNVVALYIFNNGDEAIALKKNALVYIPNLKLSQENIKISNAPQVQYDQEHTFSDDIHVILNPVNTNFYVLVRAPYSTDAEEGLYAFHKN